MYMNVNGNNNNVYRNDKMSCERREEISKRITNMASTSKYNFSISYFYFINCNFYDYI